MGNPSSAKVPPDIAQGPLSALYKRLQSSEQGLTSEEASRRLAEAGPNDPSPAKRGGLAVQLLSLFANPLVVILLLAAIVSGVLGDKVDASIIVVIVLLSVGLNFFQTYRAQTSADRLRAQVAPTATVLRDRRWQEIPARAVVPGDVIRLSAGDLVPADARLIEAQYLHVQEAALTGESMPVGKEAMDSATAAGLRAHNTVWLGTSVASGTAKAIVVATGRATEFGDIAARLSARAPETEFDRGTRKFGWLIKLKNSDRNCSFQRSVITNVLNTEKSMLTIPGPERILRPALPQNPGNGFWKAAGLNHNWRFCPPAGIMETPAMRSGRVSPPALEKSSALWIS